MVNQINEGNSKAMKVFLFFNETKFRELIIIFKIPNSKAPMNDNAIPDFPNSVQAFE